MNSTLESVSGAAQIAGHLLAWPLLRNYRRRWGTTADERQRALPGDALISEPEWGYDHAIDIDAPRSAVWPWLMQLGQGRGGFRRPSRLLSLREAEQEIE